MRDKIGLAKAFSDAIGETGRGYKRGFYSLPKGMQKNIENPETFREMVEDYIGLNALICDFLDYRSLQGIEYSLSHNQIFRMWSCVLEIVGIIHDIDIYESAEKEGLEDIKKEIAHISRIVKSMED